MKRSALPEPARVRTAEVETTFFNVRADLADVSDLQRSIEDKGLLQPIVVRQLHGRYQLICGHRRLQAYKNLGWEKIPALIMNVSDKVGFEVALTENVQRCSLDPYEEAEAFRRYVSDYGWGGISELAKKICKSKEFVSHRILMLDLSPSVREKISRRLLSPSQATELVWLKDRASREELAERLAQTRVSFRDTRRIVRLVKSGCAIQEAFGIIEPVELTLHSPEVVSLNQLKKAIVSCRSSLFVLDSVINQLEESQGNSEEVAALVLRERIVLHGLIDRLIVEKVNLERRIRKLGLQ